MLLKVGRFLTERSMVEPGDRVLVGVSGGMDSVALLHVLTRLAPTLGIAVRAAHFHHGIRDEADGDEAFVRALCAEHDVPLTVGRADVPKLAAERRLSLEVAAREARHGFFRETLAGTGCNRLALAHHRDDQGETVLLRLLRGAGAAGLSAMAPVEATGIIRPFLCVNRSDIAGYCEANGLTHREDATNADRTIPRNWVRHGLLPELRAHLNPAATEVLCRTADLLRQDDEALATLAAAALADAIRRPGEVSVPVTVLNAQPMAVRTRMLRRMAAEVGLPQDVHEVQIADMLTLLEPGKSGRRITLPRGILAARESDTLALLMEWAESPPIEPVTLVCPGDTVLPNGVLRCTRLNARPASLTEGAPQALLIDGGKLPAGAVVRSRRPGDRMRPLGAPGHRKLQDVLVDRAIPPRLREGPLLAIGDEVLAMPGVAVSDALRVDGNTTEWIRITYILGEEPYVPHD